jgi:hypothetical protein
MQKQLRTGFGTLMLALSMQSAAMVNSALAADISDDGFAADDFVFVAPLARENSAEQDFIAPMASAANEMWMPSADDSNAHIFMLLQHVGALDNDAHHDYLLI